MAKKPTDLPKARKGVVIVSAKTWNLLREILIAGWPIEGDGIKINQLPFGRSIRVNSIPDSSDSSSSESSSDSSSSDSGSPSVPSSDSGSPPPSSGSDSGSPGSSKDCVVAFRDTFIRWHCVERPEVVFEDVFKVRLRKGKGKLTLPAEMIESCEPGSIEPTAVITDRPAATGVRIEGNTLIVEGIARKLPNWATVTVAGTRKGFAGIRWEQADADAARRNAELWAILNGQTSPL